VELLPKDFTKGFSRLKLLEVECANSVFSYFCCELTNWLNHISNGIEMAEERAEQRRLAAIMFTDMVGFSALAQRDEALALELLEEHWTLLRHIFLKHRGHEIKTIGDGFLVEFASAVAAVNCAVEVQEALARRNVDTSADRLFQVRIGIHLGDVLLHGNDIVRWREHRSKG